MLDRLRAEHGTVATLIAPAVVLAEVGALIERLEPVLNASC